MGTKFLNWANKKGGNLFQLWRIWAVFKSLIRLIWQVPYAILFTRGLKKLSRADDVLFIDGLWYIEWLRDGFSLRGSRIFCITTLIRKDLHRASWVTKSALRHIFSPYGE